LTNRVTSYTISAECILFYHVTRSLLENASTARSPARITVRESGRSVDGAELQLCNRIGGEQLVRCTTPAAITLRSQPHASGRDDIGGALGNDDEDDDNGGQEETNAPQEPVLHPVAFWCRRMLSELRCIDMQGRLWSWRGRRRRRQIRRCLTLGRSHRCHWRWWQRRQRRLD